MVSVSFISSEKYELQIRRKYSTFSSSFLDQKMCITKDPKPCELDSDQAILMKELKR